MKADVLFAETVDIQSVIKKVYSFISTAHTKIVSKKLININIRGENKMNKNSSIGCNVCQCKHHAGTENYCTLTKINVGTHEANPTKKECTDCESFITK